ncbi:MAG TPA: cupin domain-containing protein [bacterium]|nr:cupin domain-containing protein [bacterium]
MELVNTRSARGFFKIVAQSPRSQAATMTLRPGQSTGGEDNLHPHADQWLYVVSGLGQATVEGETLTLEAGALLLIEAGETHEISNRGQDPLITINIYTPPAY